MSSIKLLPCEAGKSSSYVKNSAHFMERISNALIHSNQMENLDVVSLFTKVPTDETLAVVQDKDCRSLVGRTHLYLDR